MMAALLRVERRALGQVWRRKKLLAAHLVGNAVILGGVYAWLGIAEANWLAVVFSAALAVLLVFAALWLHAAALAAFYGAPARAALKRLHRVLPWAALGAAVVLGGLWLAGYAPRIAAWLASLLTLRLRLPVSPRQVDWVFPTLLRGLCCVAVLILAPLASQAAGGGRARAALRLAARPRYWLACAVLVLAGLYLPGRLIQWVPALDSLAARALSVAFRFGLAYALAVTAWLTLAAVIAQFAQQPLQRGDSDANADA